MPLGQRGKLRFCSAWPQRAERSVGQRRVGPPACRSTMIAALRVIRSSSRSPNPTMTSSPSSTLAAEHAGSAPAGATVPGSAPSSRDALLEPVLSQLDVLTIELADDYRIVRVGDACAAISGFATDEVLGRSYLRSFLLPEDIESVRAAFAQLDEGADCRDFECHLLTKDGERRRTRWAFRAVEAEDATARSYVGVCLLQVSETPEAPEALVESASSPEQPNRMP